MIDWRKTMKMRKLFFVFFFNIHVHLFICLCQVWYSSSLQYTVVASCGIQFSDQDPTQGPLHCRPGVLTLWTTRESQRDESFLETLGILCMRRVSQVAIVVKNAPANAGDLRVPDSIQGQENPRRRTWQPTLVFLPGESHGFWGSGSLQSIGLQRVRHDGSDLACMHVQEEHSFKLSFGI